MAAKPLVSDFPHGRVPRAVRERQIIDAAELLFAERGFERASMDELARRVGVSKPVIYAIVGSKDALFQLCFERAGEELALAMAEAAAAHEGDVAAMLQASAARFLDFIEHHRSAWFVLYGLDAGGRTDEQVRVIRRRQAGYVAATLTQLSPGLEPARGEAIAYMLNGMFESLAHWRLEHPTAAPEDCAQWLVELALPGLAQLLAG